MSSRPIICSIDPAPSDAEVVRVIATEMEVDWQLFPGAEEYLAADAVRDRGCIVTEIRLSGINGIEMIERLAANRVRRPVIFLTAHAETRLTVRAMRAGAITVLEKPPSRQELWDTIREALQIDEKITRIDKKHSAIRQQLGRLTRKERHVLDMMIEGRPNKSIASRLGVSIRTVEARRQQIFRKTKTTSVAELVKLIVSSDPGYQETE